MSVRRLRLDAKVAADLDVSRTKAAALIMAGHVIHPKGQALKPGQLVGPAETFGYPAADTNVSRAAGKLAPAFTDWQWNIDGKIVLDVGSSTGGFTQVALENGAAKVYAIDVGRGQLAWSLRNDARVVSMEQTDIRNVTSLPKQPTVAVVDVSFTSLRTILPAVAGLLPASAPVAALFKPQFEVGKAVADRFRGVIADEAVVAEALAEFETWLTAHQWTLKARVPSPVRGARGNQEHLLWLITPDAR